MMKSGLHIFALLVGVFFAARTPLSGQTAADSLRKAYDFKAAVELGEKLLSGADSSSRAMLEDDLILSQNGLNMTDFCSQPIVVAKYAFSLDEFFLFYPMENHSWRAVPNSLDTLGTDGPVRAMYVPEGSGRIYYSAKDRKGIRNLYRTSLRDTLWAAPELLSPNLTSSSNEIYPMLSPDGKSLYFASDGLYGMGGFDLYVSTWNEESREWGTPANLGFPYSSPYDDFLFVNTADGRYSVFASNRECSSDSVMVYVLEFDIMPVRKKMGSAGELRELCKLTPQSDPSRMNYSQAVSANVQEEDANVTRYMEKMANVRALRDSISLYNRNLDKLRATLQSDEITDRQALKNEIAAKEAAIPAMSSNLEKAVRELQQIEMDFLMSGVVINPDKIKAEADREVVGASSDYVFSKNEMGAALDIRIEQPEAFNYDFQVLGTARFAEDATLPEGIVYQIQLFCNNSVATEERLHGLSPVFESRLGDSYVYSVGLFRQYGEALGKLETVRSLGFDGAFITAYFNGQPTPVVVARILEGEKDILTETREETGESEEDSNISVAENAQTIAE